MGPCPPEDSPLLAAASVHNESAPEDEEMGPCPPADSPPLAAASVDNESAPEDEGVYVEVPTFIGAPEVPPALQKFMRAFAELGLHTEKDARVLCDLVSDVVTLGLQPCQVPLAKDVLAAIKNLGRRCNPEIGHQWIESGKVALEKRRGVVWTTRASGQGAAGGA